MLKLFRKLKLGYFIKIKHIGIHVESVVNKTFILILENFCSCF